MIRAKQREEKQKNAARNREESDRAKGERRSDRKVSGVSFATTLGEESAGTKRRGRKKSPDVYELIPRNRWKTVIPASYGE